MHEGAVVSHTKTCIHVVVVVLSSRQRKLINRIEVIPGGRPSLHNAYYPLITCLTLAVISRSH